VMCHNSYLVCLAPIIAGTYLLRFSFFNKEK
jgi:hypothetical protein